MKKLISLSCLVLMLSSCSSIEKATSKWKTPDAPNAGLAEGQKSHYLTGKSKDAPMAPAPITAKEKPKKDHHVEEVKEVKKEAKKDVKKKTTEKKSAKKSSKKAADKKIKKKTAIKKASKE